MSKSFLSLKNPPMSLIFFVGPTLILLARPVRLTAGRRGLPEHASVFLMPHLDPLFPLVFVEFVLLQDSAKIVNDQKIADDRQEGREALSAL